MIDYIKAQTKTNELVISGAIQGDEQKRIAKADLRWAENRGKRFQTRKIRKGEIYQFEFGKNYMPEMSYEHRGLIIRVNDKLVYVLPIFSYLPSKHTDVYHPIAFPDSKSDLYLLKSNEYSFIKRDSVLKLNDIRTVSINRIQFQQHGRMDIASDTFKEIEALAFQKYFPEFHYEYLKMKETIMQLEEEVKRIKDSESWHKENSDPSYV